MNWLRRRRAPASIPATVNPNADTYRCDIFSAVGDGWRWSVYFDEYRVGHGLALTRDSAEKKARRYVEDHHASRTSRRTFEVRP
jgi:hypothetical protein